MTVDVCFYCRPDGHGRDRQVDVWVTGTADSITVRTDACDSYFVKCSTADQQTAVRLSQDVHIQQLGNTGTSLISDILAH